MARKTSQPRRSQARMRPARRGGRNGPARSGALRPPRRYLLRLYVTGATPASRRAIENAKALCQEHLAGRFRLEVFDIYQMPALAKDHQIIAAPTLIRVLPTPLRRFVGDLSRGEKVLFGLDLREGA
jgi:circadian clock protein KaiB